MIPFNWLTHSDDDIMVGLTQFQYAFALGDLATETTTNVAGPGSTLLSGSTLAGTTLVNGDVHGPVTNGHDNVVANGAGAVAAQGENVNIGSGQLVDIDGSWLSEALIGDGTLVSNDQTAWAADGSAVSFGAGSATGAGDVSVAAGFVDGNLAVQTGEGNDLLQVEDESTTVDIALDYETVSIDDHSQVAAIWDSFNDDHSMEIIDSFKSLIDASNTDNHGVVVGG